MSNLTINPNTNSIIAFNFNDMNVRVIDKGNDPWFIASDICAILEINNPSQAISYLDDDEKNTLIINEGNRGNPEKAIINESGLYSLILRSRKSEAKRFKKWVTSEVLPSIRKTGSYQPVDLNDPAFLRTTLLSYTEKCLALESENKELKIKSDALDTIASHQGLFCLRVAAKTLSITQTKLIDYLSQNRWIYKIQGKGNWIAYQDKINAGYLKHKSNPVNGVERSQTLVTTKGLRKIAILFKIKGVA